MTRVKEKDWLQEHIKKCHVSIIFSILYTTHFIFHLPQISIEMQLKLWKKKKGETLTSTKSAQKGKKFSWWRILLLSVSIFWWKWKSDKKNGEASSVSHYFCGRKGIFRRQKELWNFDFQWIIIVRVINSKSELKIWWNYKGTSHTIINSLLFFISNERRGRGFS